MSRINEDASDLNNDNAEQVDTEKPCTSSSTDANEDLGLSIENSNIEENDEMQRFKLLFNKHGHDLEARKCSKNDEKQKKENRYGMSFGKDNSSKTKNEKTSEAKKFGNPDGFRLRNRFPPSTSFHNSEFMNQNYAQRLATGCGKPFNPDIITYKWQSDANKNPQENDIRALKNIFSDGMIHHDLKPYYSFTSLDSSSADVLKWKISSLTTIETTPIAWQDLAVTDEDLEKRLNLQISKSSKDNTRRKFRRDELVSVSDSELLFDYRDEARKTVKKCDKKSRGDSTKRERELVNRKQVQWKPEVDVIYFSSHLIADGDRTGEVIGRVVEPLREEWEQQRKGLYTKMIDSRWISLKI